MHTFFTSESVASGHPDKVADQISDAVVDAALRVDPKARVAVETLVTKNRVVLAGEVTCTEKLAYQTIARGVIADLGYTRDIFRFSHTSPISLYIHEQSPDIATGVDDGGAGDQGMMFGFAVNETSSLMPLPISLAHALTRAMDKARTEKTIPFLRPDGKSEVTIRYERGKPKEVSRIVLAVPHSPKITNNELKRALVSAVIKPVVQSFHLNMPGLSEVIINGTGVWEIGGPSSDTGVTGRKIIVDTYGSYARHGGGAFSGKDPTKVDRSGAYAMRYLAKNIVAHKYADRCETRVAYVIGKRDPIDLGIECFGTERKPLAVIESFAKSLLSLSVKGIIEGLTLAQPIYRNSARYGHFGREEFPWEQTS